MDDHHHSAINDLCETLLMIRTPEEALNFLKDLCTPKELRELAQRWLVCKLIDQGLSYREIQKIAGTSLTQIGRVARFLKEEPYHGYRTLLERIKNEKKNE
jgi:TrpR-related protein YerC/YecD